MESRPGEIVRSLAGHDRLEYYMVLKSEGGELLLVNGRNKDLLHPKKKKQKHVQIIRGTDETICEKLASGKISDADVIHLLKAGKEKKNV